MIYGSTKFNVFDLNFNNQLIYHHLIIIIPTF